MPEVFARLQQASIGNGMNPSGEQSALLQRLTMETVVAAVVQREREHVNQGVQAGAAEERGYPHSSHHHFRFWS